jgi:integrase-like protein
MEGFLWQSVRANHAANAPNRMDKLGFARAVDLVSQQAHECVEGVFFDRASELFLREYDIITQGQRSKVYVEGQQRRSQGHLVPFFGQLGLSEITAGKIQDYRIHRHEEAVAKRGKPPARNTMHQEMVALRQTLKTAIRHGWLDRLPDLSEPYRSSPKISRRIQKTLRSHEKARAGAEEGGLQMGIGTASRLRAVRGQYRPAARRGMAPGIPGCHDR